MSQLSFCFWIIYWNRIFWSGVTVFRTNPLDSSRHRSAFVVSLFTPFLRSLTCGTCWKILKFLTWAFFFFLIRNASNADFLERFTSKGVFLSSLMWSRWCTHIFFFFLQNVIEKIKKRKENKVGNRIYGALGGLGRVIHRIYSNRAVRVKVTDKTANSNVLQECVYSLSSIQNYTLMCAFQYAYMGAVH